MQLGMSGLGRMGANVQKLTMPRAALVMVPAGMAAIEEAVPCDVSTRFRPRQEHTFAEKMLSGMRNKFGGHMERASGG
jgi:6-phosphogluconate dehydrogenase (decarboxylating)